MTQKIVEKLVEKHSEALHNELSDIRNKIAKNYLIKPQKSHGRGTFLLKHKTNQQRHLKQQSSAWSKQMTTLEVPANQRNTMMSAVKTMSIHPTSQCETWSTNADPSKTV